MLHSLIHQVVIGDAAEDAAAHVGAHVPMAAKIHVLALVRVVVDVAGHARIAAPLIAVGDAAVEMFTN